MSPWWKVQRNIDWLILAGLFIAGFVALWATESSVGFVRDESIYFPAARYCAIWLMQLVRDPSTALSDAAIVRAFDFNHEHPALMKLLFGISHQVFHEKFHWLRPATAFRIPAFAVAALIPPLLYRFGTSLYGRTAGLFAALSFFLVPRQFFNAHLACFDVPIATFWLLTVYLFWKAQGAPRYWLWCGVSFGLAVATKHNGWFLPFVLAPLGLWRLVSLARRSNGTRVVFGFSRPMVCNFGSLSRSVDLRWQSPIRGPLRRSESSDRVGVDADWRNDLDPEPASSSESAGISRDRPALRNGVHRSRDLLSALALSLAPSDRARRLVF
jgi:hypothetical protein